MFQTNVVWVFGIACIKLKSYFLLDVCDSYRHLNNNNRVFKSVAISIFPHFITSLCFVIFVIFWNRGQITVGHQEHHILSRHYAQLVYLVTFLFWSSMANLPIYFFTRLRKLCQKRGYFPSSRSLCFISLVFIVSFFISNTCMTRGWLVHPFILSDNRHFTFSIHRRFLSHKVCRHVVLPLIAALAATSFAFSSGVLSSRRVSLSSILDFLIFLGCCSVTLIPAPLLEPRYFHIPCALFLLHLPIERPTSVEASRDNGEKHRRESIVSSIIAGPKQQQQTQQQQQQTSVYRHEDFGFVKASRLLSLSSFRCVELMNIVVYVLINCWVFNLFLFKPFPSFSHETGESELGRKMY